MTITRVIHGEKISIELTEEELRQAQEEPANEARRITGKIFCVEKNPGDSDRHYIEVDSHLTDNWPHETQAKHDDILKKVARYCAANGFSGRKCHVTQLNLRTIWKDHFKYENYTKAFCDEMMRLKKNGFL